MTYPVKATLTFKIPESQRLIDALDEWRDVLTVRLIRRGRIREAIELQATRN